MEEWERNHLKERIEQAKRENERLADTERVKLIEELRRLESENARMRRRQAPAPGDAWLPPWISYGGTSAYDAAVNGPAYDTVIGIGPTTGVYGFG